MSFKSIKMLAIMLLTAGVCQAASILPPAKSLSLKELRDLEQQGKAYRLPAKTAGRFYDSKRLELPRADRQGIALQNNPNSVLNQRRLPSRLTAEGGNVYGYLAYSDKPGTGMGIYEITADGYDYVWSDPLFEDFSIKATNAWYDEGVLKGTAMLVMFDYIWGYYYYEIDFLSGELLRIVDYYSWAESVFYNCTLNAEGNTLYGFVLNLTDGVTYWASAPANEPYNVTCIAPAEDSFCYSLCRGMDEDVFYGVTDSQQFVEINIADGSQTVITEVPDAAEMSNYLTGLVWNPEAKLFYWNAYTTSHESSLYTITADGVFSKSFDFPAGDQFTYFITTDSYVKDDQPLKPAIDEISFTDGSLEGKVTFLLPSYFGDGSELPASLVCTALLDGEYYDTFMGAPGQPATVNYKVEERGFHVLGLYVTVNGVASPTVTERVYIGFDNPKSPSNVNLTTEMVSWDAVTAGVNGGYVNAAEMEYMVYINEDLIGTTSGTSMAVSLPTDLPLAGYTAYVTAVADGYESEPGASNTVVSGVAFDLPVNFAPTEDEFTLMTVYDANSDGSTWYYNTTMRAAATSYTLNPDGTMDDYLFLPPVNLTDTEKYYTFSFNVGLIGDAYTDEWVEGVVASMPVADAVMDVVIDKFRPTATPEYSNDYSDWNSLSGLVKVDKPGEYYLGVHCISSPFMLGVAVRNLSVADENITGNSPVAPTDLEITPADGGELKAEVSFTMPLLTVGGSEIPSGTEITAVVTVNDETGTTVTAKAGEKVTTDVTTQAGYNVISVRLQSGGVNSPRVSSTVYTGPSVPATPANVKMEVNEDMMGAVITWDAVTEADIPGAYIDPETVDYILYKYDMEFDGWYPYVEGIDDTYFEVEVEAGEPQAQYLFGVASNNEFGSNDRLRYASGIMGTPYALPFVDVITANGFTYTPWLTYNEFNGQNYGGSLYLDVLSGIDSAFDDDETYAILGMSTTGMPEMELLGMPRFSTAGISDASFSIDVVKGPDAADLNIFGVVYGDNTPVHIATIKGHSETAELTTMTFDVPAALLDKTWVQVYLEMNFVYFDDFVAFSKVSVTSGSGVTEITADSRGFITATKGNIVVRGFEGKPLSVYTLDGKPVMRATVRSNETSVAVAPGVYVVTAGETRVKVIVK